MTALFDLDPPPMVPTTEGERFPVRRIFCVGKNYAEHVAEMGGDANADPPVFFTKPADAAIVPKALADKVAYPPATEDLHFEGEFVLALKGGGADLAAADLPLILYGVALGCDLTRRDLQRAAKTSGTPWDMAKGFDQSAVIGPITPMADLPPDTGLTLSVNGALRQEGTAGEMIFAPGAVIAALSRLVRLRPGDLIYTGTPSGVGPLSRGDRVEITGTGLAPCAFTMA